MLVTGALATRSKTSFNSLARIVLIPLATAMGIPLAYSDQSIFTTGRSSKFIAGFLGPNQRPQVIVFSFLKRMHSGRFSIVRYTDHRVAPDDLNTGTPSVERLSPSVQDSPGNNPSVSRA